MNLVRALSDLEIAALERLNRRTENADVRSRCDMILWSNEGLSPPLIAERVRFSHDTVSRYIARYESEGIQGFLPRPRSERPRKVTAEYEVLLLELVAQGPRKLGIPFSNWITSNFAAELGKLIGTELTARHVETYLKANDWALQCPVRTVQHKQDPELVKEKKTDP